MEYQGDSNPKIASYRKKFRLFKSSCGARHRSVSDLDPLRLHPQVEVHWVRPGDAIPPADLIILPGSKSTRGDLKRLREQGWDAAIHRHLRYGGKLIGICGGFQMLGRWVHDPTGLEGEPAWRWRIPPSD